MKSRILVCVCGADGEKPRYYRVFTGTILAYFSWSRNFCFSTSAVASVFAKSCNLRLHIKLTTESLPLALTFLIHLRRSFLQFVFADIASPK